MEANANQAEPPAEPSGDLPPSPRHHYSSPSTSDYGDPRYSNQLAFYDRFGWPKVEAAAPSLQRGSESQASESDVWTTSRSLSPMIEDTTDSTQDDQVSSYIQWQSASILRHTLKRHTYEEKAVQAGPEHGLTVCDCRRRGERGKEGGERLPTARPSKRKREENISDKENVREGSNRKDVEAKRQGV